MLVLSIGTLIFVNEKRIETLNETIIVRKGQMKSLHVPVGRKVCSESNLKLLFYLTKKRFNLSKIPSIMLKYLYFICFLSILIYF